MACQRQVNVTANILQGNIVGTSDVAGDIIKNVINNITGCGVTANILVLGTSDSGFESQHPDSI